MTRPFTISRTPQGWRLSNPPSLHRFKRQALSHGLAASRPQRQS